MGLTNSDAKRLQQERDHYFFAMINEFGRDVAEEAEAECLRAHRDSLRERNQCLSQKLFSLRAERDREG